MSAIYTRVIQLEWWKYTRNWVRKGGQPADGTGVDSLYELLLADYILHTHKHKWKIYTFFVLSVLLCVFISFPVLSFTEFLRMCYLKLLILESDGYRPLDSQPSSWWCNRPTVKAAKCNLFHILSKQHSTSITPWIKKRWTQKRMRWFLEVTHSCVFPSDFGGQKRGKEQISFVTNISCGRGPERNGGDVVMQISR
jgi:hypothetical protein